MSSRVMRDAATGTKRTDVTMRSGQAATKRGLPKVTGED
jgi:hypothetical protein